MFDYPSVPYLWYRYQKNNNYNREGLALDVDLSMPSLRVIRTLEQIVSQP